MRSSIASAMQRFRPGIAPTLVVLVLLPLMVSLGFWQLSRGHENSCWWSVMPSAALPSRSAARSSMIWPTLPFAASIFAGN